MSIVVNNSGHFGRSHTTSLRQVQIGQQCFLDVGARGHRSVQNRWPDVKVSPEPPRTAANGSCFLLPSVQPLATGHWPVQCGKRKQEMGEIEGTGGGVGGVVMRGCLSLKEACRSLSRDIKPSAVLG